MITYLLNTLVDSIKTSLINKLGLDPSTEVDLDDFPQLIDDIPILDSVEELTVTQNGTYTGTDGVTYNPVNVNLPLDAKTITSNGTYTASDDSLQGYSSVTVDIDDTDLYRDTTDSTYESVKTLSNCGAFPMLSLTAKINAVQDLHGYDKPWAGGAGKNKFGIEEWLKAEEITYTKSGNSYTFNLDNKLYSHRFVFSDTDISTNFNATITIPSGSTASNVGFVLYSQDGTAITGRVSSFSSKTGCKIGLDWSSLGQVTITEAILTKSSDSVTPFAPYSNICPITGWDSIDVYQSGADTSNPTTYTTALSTTCYGGSKDIKGNEIHNRGHKTVNDLSWQKQTIADGRTAFIALISDAELKDNTNNTNILTGAYPEDTAVTSTYYLAEGTCKMGGTYFGRGYLTICDSRFDTASDFKTAMGDIDICYDLATPTTATSDAIDLTLAEGVNNLWANSGDVGDARYFRKVEL